MGKSTSNQTVVVLALILVLIVIGGTFLVMQEVRKLSKGNHQYGTQGKVSVYVITPQEQVDDTGGKVNVYVITNQPNE